MKTSLDLQAKDEHLYVPEPARIVEIQDFSDAERYFKCELLSGKSLGHMPGQFVQVSVLGIGEAPFCVSSAPSDDRTFELCIRKVGDLTVKLHTLAVGDTIHIRGPFGHGFDHNILQRMEGKHLLFVAGGMGYVPARSLINLVLAQKEKYQKISILYGCKSCKGRMFPKELEAIDQIGGNVELLETVDCVLDDESWGGCVGVITTLIPKVTFDPQNTVAVVIGPPIMYKFVLQSLAEKGMPQDNIYVSLERRMKCGVGKCGHCKMEGVYVCQEGPVFNCADLVDNREAF